MCSPDAKCVRWSYHVLHSCPDAHLARANGPAEEPSLTIHEVRGGRPPHAVEAPGHVAARIEEHGRFVAALFDGLAHECHILTEVDEPHLETLAAELLVQRVDGRQLLPAVGSPGGPEEEQHHLPAQVGETLCLSSEVEQLEGWRSFGRLQALHLEGGEVRACGRRRGGRERGGHHDGGEAATHQMPAAFTAASKSAGSRRSSGLSMTLTNFTTPFLSITK